MQIHGVELIEAERRRQIIEESHDPAHDRHYTYGELRQAAMAYLLACSYYDTEARPVLVWPWSPSGFKPRDELSNLIRAGALIAAEIDRVKARGPERELQ